MKNERGIEISQRLPREEMYCWWCTRVDGLHSTYVTIEDGGMAYRCDACGETGRICACCGHPLHGQCLPRWFVHKESGRKLYFCTGTCGEALISQYGELIELGRRDKASA